MTQDAPSHQDGPRINGVAEPASASVSDVSHSLLQICDELRRKVTTFLDEQTDSKVLQGVQRQVRVSIRVIEEAMRRYGYVMLLRLILKRPRESPGGTYRCKGDDYDWR